ncbi:hypothetical protein CLIB1423_11S04566 [[Candida] railenensis]|uniref:Zn(2)-C6 fungal-type domain-containing protein n=1 Tax=[Candida] railenensis TaxID=45579 RepID=A0A9P0VZ67_9ASCO|nr:hypothetical protein CLIB1423_11S04566 [[Candida] railenensis]
MTSKAPISSKPNVVEAKISKRKPRPCDACALRKVKCNLNEQNPCSRCSQHEIACTNVRTRKNPGPKSLHGRTLKGIEEFKSRTDSDIAKQSQISTLTINLSQLAPFLSIYQKLFYSIWPVVSLKELMRNIVGEHHDKTPGQGLPKDIPITKENYSYCSLAYALCAAVRCQISFVSKEASDLEVPKSISASSFANQAQKIKNEFDFFNEPTVEKSLTLFFLYAYCVNVKGRDNSAVVLLRDSITMIQIIAIIKRKQKEPANISNADMHRFVKIYYVLLVTERYMCIVSEVPVLLESNLPLPMFEEEEFPEEIAAFIELIKVFSIPSKQFFDQLLEQRSPRSVYFKGGLTYVAPPSIDIHMRELQNGLLRIGVYVLTQELQKLNILLSKYWMMAVAWKMCYNGQMLEPSTDESDPMGFLFPITIAREFLQATGELNLTAFECNGPGVCIKLFEIAIVLRLCIKEVIPENRHQYYDLITAILKVMGRFKADLVDVLHHSKKFAEVVADGSDTLDIHTMQNYFFSESSSVTPVTGVGAASVELPPGKVLPQDPSSLRTPLFPQSSNNINSLDGRTNYHINLNDFQFNDFNNLAIEPLLDNRELIENQSVDFSRVFNFEVSSNVESNWLASKGYEEESPDNMKVDNVGKNESPDDVFGYFNPQSISSDEPKSNSPSSILPFNQL